MTVEKTQVVIIGGGPSGMLLAHALQLMNINSIVLERRPRDYVLQRIRAGMLKPAAVKILRALGLSERLDKEGMQQRTVCYGWQNKATLELDLPKLCGEHMMAYGQSALTEDLYRAHDQAGRILIDGVEDIRLQHLQTAPVVSYRKEGHWRTLHCEFVAGCDGQYGIGKQHIPAEVCRRYERRYDFGWLGVLAQVPPVPELVYARHEEGFVLASKRNPQLSRYYVQVALSDKPDDWPDERFWEAVLRRLPPETAAKVETGASIEKSITPLQSHVVEPMQYGRLFLAGDAAHIVPPTGARGLNLAVSDVYYLSRALDAHYHQANDDLLAGYSATALYHVWNAVNFSWRMTTWLHQFAGEDAFYQKLRDNEFDVLLSSEQSRIAFAREFCGTNADINI